MCSLVQPNNEVFDSLRQANHVTGKASENIICEIVSLLDLCMSDDPDIESNVEIV